MTLANERGAIDIVRIEASLEAVAAQVAAGVLREFPLEDCETSVLNGPELIRSECGVFARFIFDRTLAYMGLRGDQAAELLRVTLRAYTDQKLKALAAALSFETSADLGGAEELFSAFGGDASGSLAQSVIHAERALCEHVLREYPKSRRSPALTASVRQAGRDVVRTSADLTGLPDFYSLVQDSR